ncbi:MAG: HAMP domain-containing protein, partial [Anaerolineae bacterium]|nr:HAMP domain-containing protein [Anaerolineae bacterium]
YVLLAFLGIGVAFTVAALAYVDRLLLRLSRLSETMTRIRETDDVSVDVIVDGQDEIANLANGLREMLAALARSRNELWQTNDYLEKLVEQRTADLVQTNEILLQEVAERKQAQADLAQARDQALEVLRLKSHILANISHDARTPLSVILMGAQMLELGRYGPVNEKQREKLESISDHVNQLDGFISNLLDGVTMNNAKLRLEPADVAPVDLLSNLDTDLGPLARRKGLELTWAISDEVPEVIHTDAKRFNQILSNLVGNAIKFTKEGSVKVRLYCPDDRHWALEVSDTGPGIEVNAQDHIFDAFWQVDGSMTRETSRGVGLGLSIVKQLTGLMNGKTAVVSKIGVGTTFRLVFPLDKNDEMAVDAQAVRAGR